MTVEFQARTEPFRRELLAHCYRMLGSFHDAEDLVQETYVRALRGYAGFQGRSSVRVWLYRIATTACLDHLEGRRRRALPSGLGAPEHDHRVRLVPGAADVPWLGPAPDHRLGVGDDPADIVAARSGVRLAFVAALQLLPARQRAVLILRDVLAWRAAEVAEVLSTTTVAVNSALRRARDTLAPVVADDLSEPPDPATRAVLDRYVTAFVRADVDALVGLLRADVELEMPPIPTWFTGADAVGRFLAERAALWPDRWLVRHTRANGGPALAMYVLDPGRHEYAAHGITLLSLLGGRVSRVVVFNDETLFPVFDLPVTEPARAAARAASRAQGEARR
ncbi:sigma-70 family RNA polymerase sigma factor [Dactylosporangium aurantiacum]|uniref:Sigma-70 family RNA polymerase sigma factor n=1 Tax=Dactylosporangium aurantiacum TaxID=35754 RepID=A0A9Q9IMA9_9ACTN|nr:sigma-70 family RNA polymerase sigma factor [Dactylosporangium aurantiacum]MDG6106217.1 sigma-70 family RNA polymerase sigma factor [Dactylosporangium aurantiacum]UWZ58281.1 sigma-70 family RNA polymerase sigma factor [Dactylosporangium aurantiacum]